MKRIVLFILATAALAACATNPVQDNAKAIAQARTQGVPVFIYSHPAQDRLGFVNTSGRPIDAVVIKVAMCQVHGETSADSYQPYWLHVAFQGNFQPDGSYQVKSDKAAVMDANHNVLPRKVARSYPHSKVVAVRVHYADGSPEQVVSNVSSMLAPQVPNACPPLVGMPVSQTPAR